MIKLSKHAPRQGGAGLFLLCIKAYLTKWPNVLVKLAQRLIIIMCNDKHMRAKRMRYVTPQKGMFLRGGRYYGMLRLYDPAKQRLKLCEFSLRCPDWNISKSRFKTIKLQKRLNKRLTLANIREGLVFIAGS